MRTEVAAALLTLAATLSVAQARGPLDSIDQRRNQCLIDRVAAAGRNGPDPCGRLSTPEREYFQTRRDEFCSHPGGFCSYVRATHPSIALERDRLFVSPRCEGLLPRCPNGDFFSCNEISTDGDFPTWTRRSWGCDEGEPQIQSSAVGVAVRLRFRCDAERMPFECTSRRARERDFPSRDARSRALRDAHAALSEMALEASNAHLIREGDRCIVEVADSGEGYGSRVSHLPAARVGETYRDYEARLSASQRTELHQRHAAARKRSRRVFQAEMSGSGLQRFTATARTVLTEERIRLGERAFEASKKAVLDYLRSLNPPAPQIIIQSVERTRLLNLRAFRRQPPSRADAESIRKVQEACNNTRTSIGDVNAINTPAPNGSLVTLCPAALLDADYSNPRALLSLLTHELGHSVDPCMTELLMDSRLRTCRGGGPVPEAADATETSRRQAWSQRLSGDRGWVACMTRSNPRTGVTEGNSDYATRTLAAILQDGSDCLKLPADVQCMVRQDLIRGPARNCMANPGGHLHLDADKCPTAHPFGMGYGGHPSSDIQDSTARETFADFVAARSLTRALDEFGPPLASMSREDRAAEILTTLPGFCGNDHLSNDTHADGRIRTGVFATSPEIRAAMGCSLSPAPSVALPAAACPGAFDRAP